jgi:DNA-binding phage protein
MGAVLHEFGEPFARALAVFIRETAGLPPSGPPSAKESSVLAELQSFNDLDPALRQELNQVIEEQDRLSVDSDNGSVEFTEDTPAQFAANRLRHVASQKGLTQKEIAEKLGVTPAAVNRVFQHPERSKVKTLRRIADALGVELYEIVR